MKAMAYYEGEPVTVIDVNGVMALIVVSQNPVQVIWVNSYELDSITWLVG
jgi:hypothetical protein